MSTTLIHYFNLCLQERASILQITGKLPWNGKDRKANACTMEIKARSAVESLTMFFCFTYDTDSLMESSFLLRHRSKNPKCLILTDVKKVFEMWLLKHETLN